MWCGHKTQVPGRTKPDQKGRAANLSNGDATQIAPDNPMLTVQLTDIECPNDASDRSANPNGQNASSAAASIAVNELHRRSG